jgi:hypothetical protein
VLAARGIMLDVCVNVCKIGVEIGRPPEVFIPRPGPLFLSQRENVRHA